MQFLRKLSVGLGVLVCGVLPVGAQEFELVQPESYAVRRFAEVVESQLADMERKDQTEILIELRAQLAVANRRMDQIRNLSNGGSSEETLLPLTQENSYRAARALRDHYQRKLERLENSAKRKSAK